MAQSPSSDAKFRAIFDAHLPMVQRYCTRRLGVADANDAVSEVFLVMWRRIDEIPSGPESLPLLHGVARNVVRNSQRTMRRSDRLIAKAGDEPQRAAASAEMQVVRRSEFDEVAEALGELSEDDREVIRLRAWEELSAPQIAVVLDVSVAAAEKRIARASTRLTKKVEQKRSIRPRAIQKGGDDREN